MVCVLSAVACSSSGHAAPRVVAFDVHRRLTADSSRAINALSGTASVLPANLTDADLMSGITTPFLGFADATTRARYDAQIARADAAAVKYSDAESAAADGYVLTSYFIPNFGTHWINWALVTRPFDPARPAMLLYDGDGTRAHLLGLSYYQWSPNGVPPDGFAGANDRWHRHFGTCYAGGFLIGENVATRDVCRKTCRARATNAIKAKVGTTAEIPELARYLAAHPEPAPPLDFCNLVPGDDIWMLHLWIVPGHPNPTGLFSTFNPRVSTCVGLCRKT